MKGIRLEGIFWLCAAAFWTWAEGRAWGPQSLLAFAFGVLVCEIAAVSVREIRARWTIVRRTTQGAQGKEG